jgi:hypothetical protein
VEDSPAQSPDTRYKAKQGADLPHLDDQLRKVDSPAPAAPAADFSSTPKAQSSLEASAPHLQRQRSAPLVAPSEEPVQPVQPAQPAPQGSASDAAAKSPDRSSPSFPFPAMSSPRAGRSRPPPLRKSSTSSTLAPSVISATSAHAPGTPGLRRGPAPLAPRLDLSAGKGELDGTSPPRSRNMVPSPASATSAPHSGGKGKEQALAHKRGELLATPSDATERLREVNAAAGKRQRTVSEMGNAPEALRRASGYFGSWRRGGGEQRTIVESPVNEAPPPPSFNPLKQKAQPLISKFCSPTYSSFGSQSPSSKSDSVAVAPMSTLTSSSPTEGPPRRTVSNVSLSRTQQKLLLQRDAPMAPESTSLLYPSAGSPAPALNTPALRQTAQANLQRWAQAIVREAERIDKEHATVRRFRNPVEESWRRLAGYV